jgi:hypothetical protein
MIAVATGTADPAGGVRYRAGALPALPYADRGADAVCANFVVNHTSRPRDAIAELVRVARGAVTLTIWPRRRTVLNGLWSGIVADAGATTPPSTTVPPEHDIERSEEGLAAELAAAGLHEVRTSTLEWDFAIAADELWAGVIAGVATIGTTYLAQDAGVRRRMAEAFRTRSAELVGRDGLLHLPSYGLLGSGRASA